MEYFGKANKAKEENNEKTATEIMNLKITNAQMQSYKEEQKMPNLQYLADRLCEDGEIAYVKVKDKKTADLEGNSSIKPLVKIESEEDSILTKLNEYPYEFEIDGKLRLASINGVKVADNDSSNSDLQKEIDGMKETIRNLQTEVSTLKNGTILNQRVKLTKDNFSPVDIALTTTQVDKNHGTIELKESIESYKFLEIQIDQKTEGIGYWGEKSVFIGRDNLQYNDSDAINWASTSSIFVLSQAYNGNIAGIACYFRDGKTLTIGSASTSAIGWNTIRIKEIYGIK